MRYGETVVIRDGSCLDGISGSICQSKDGIALVLIDRKVLWPAAAGIFETAGAVVVAGNR